MVAIYRAYASHPPERKRPICVALDNMGETQSYDMVFFNVPMWDFFHKSLKIWNLYNNRNIRTGRPNKKKKNRVGQERMRRIKNSDIKAPGKKSASPRRILMLPCHSGKAPCSWVIESHRTCSWKKHQGALLEKLTGLDSWFPIHNIALHLLWIKLVCMFCEQKHRSKALWELVFIDSIMGVSFHWFHKHLLSQLLL